MDTQRKASVSSFATTPLAPCSLVLFRCPLVRVFGWVDFEFVEPPTLNTYQKFDETIGGDIAHPYPHEGLEYRFANNKYTMFWHVLDMSAEEIAKKQQEVKDEWAAVVEGANPNPASWVFNEETCSFEPPIPYPSDSDGTVYSWNEETTSWIEFTEE